MSEKCTVPPAGWSCTREKGHEGPCAAVPEPKKTGISFCSHPGCGYPDGKPCHGCGAVVPKGLAVMVHADHKERDALASQLAQAQGEVAELRDKLETYDVVVAEMRLRTQVVRQVEANDRILLANHNAELLADKARLDLVIDLIYRKGTEGITDLEWSAELCEDGDPVSFVFDRAAIDAAKKP